MTANPLLAVLGVRLKHEYFGGDYPEFTVVPLHATAILLRRCGLAMLQRGATLTLYAPDSLHQKLTAANERASWAGFTLCWEIVPASRDFAAFTGVELEPRKECIVLCPDIGSGKVPDGELTSGPMVSRQDVWTRRPPRFQPSLATGVAGPLQIETISGGLIAKIPGASTVPAIDTSAAGSGLFQLSRAGVVLERWFSDERSFGAASVCVLALPGAWLAQLIAQRGAAVSPPSVPEFRAKFPAREAFWRYHIFPGSMAAESLKIVPFDADDLEGGEGGSVAASSAANDLFSPMSSQPVVGAMSFEASHPLKLTRKPAQLFSLRSGGVARYSPLPAAGLSFTRGPRSGSLCTEIFVYL
jgi:hypothetical protein